VGRTENSPFFEPRYPSFPFCEAPFLPTPPDFTSEDPRHRIFELTMSSLLREHASVSFSPFFKRSQFSPLRGTWFLGHSSFFCRPNHFLHSPQFRAHSLFSFPNKIPPAEEAFPRRHSRSCRRRAAPTTVIARSLRRPWSLSFFCSPVQKPVTPRSECGLRPQQSSMKFVPRIPGEGLPSFQVSP